VQPRHDLVADSPQRMDLRDDAADQEERRGRDVHMGGDMALLAHLVAESTFPPSPAGMRERWSPRASTGATRDVTLGSWGVAGLAAPGMSAARPGLSAAGARLQLRLAQRAKVEPSPTHAVIPYAAPATPSDPTDTAAKALESKIADLDRLGTSALGWSVSPFAAKC